MYDWVELTFMAALVFLIGCTGRYLWLSADAKVIDIETVCMEQVYE